MTAIRARDLLLRRGADFTLGPLSLDIEAGSHTVLLGPSGSGKTTVLRCLAGLEPPDAGSITLGERTVNDPAIRVAPGDRRIGFVFQDGGLWPHLTVRRHLSFVQPGIRRTDALALLEQVGISHLAARKPGALSGGEAQRLALARALAGDPQVLMLDEPFQSVDVHLRDALRLLVRRIAEERGITTVLVTHDRDDALAASDHVVILRRGRVVEAGPTRHVLEHPKTAWTAAFFGGAAAFTARELRDDKLGTVFGEMPRPEGTQGTPLALVVFPGDLAVAPKSGARHPTARVLQVLPTANGAVALIDLRGRTLRVPCSPEIAAGDELALRLRGEPRLLPADGALGER